MTKTTNIERLVADYCYASQKELNIKKTEILTLIIINLCSILVEIGVGIYLISQATPSFKPLHISQECEENFDFPIWLTILLNLLRTLGQYSTYAVVFYFIFWKHRHAARGDSLESSFDFIIDSEDDQDQQRLLLINESRKEQEEENSEGEDFLDWIKRPDSNNGSKTSLIRQKRPRKASESMEAQPNIRDRNSSLKTRNEDRHTPSFGRPNGEGIEVLKREESFITGKWA